MAETKFAKLFDLEDGSQLLIKLANSESGGPAVHVVSMIKGCIIELHTGFADTLEGWIEARKFLNFFNKAKAEKFHYVLVDMTNSEEPERSGKQLKVMN